ncbi:hypothetical protein E2C01_092064 [Portunus trituberculatus]|uniref:Uncharacterized protein n=1 Tax=Portunus trituberculatus TaxID=210409 RepID=A0A5B7JR21_PORTR|nr:hypothetical protein [Portunus trituberculatus]
MHGPTAVGPQGKLSRGTVTLHRPCPLLHVPLSVSPFLRKDFHTSGERPASGIRHRVLRSQRKH